MTYDSETKCAPEQKTVSNKISEIQKQQQSIGDGISIIRRRLAGSEPVSPKCSDEPTGMTYVLDNIITENEAIEKELSYIILVL